MTGLRSNGFVVSLAALAFFVSGMVIQRQFDRSHPGFVTISDHDFFGQDFSLSPNGQPIHTPLGDFSADSDFSAGCQGLVTDPLRELCKTDHGIFVIGSGQTDLPITQGLHGLYMVNGPVGGIIPVAGTQPAKEPRRSGLIAERPSAVPAPVDALPVDHDSSAAGSATPEENTAENSAEETASSAVRNVIERELAHTTREERDIWFDELKSLPAGVVRDLLQVRKQMRALPRVSGGAPEKLASTESVASPRQREIVAEAVSQKIRFQLPNDDSTTIALESAISQLRHNLMNAATPGFKRLRVTMVDCYSPQNFGSSPLDGIDSHPSFEARVRGEGCRMSPVQLDLKQGAFKATGRPLDLAINGDGFFHVQQGEKEFLTRCGAFALDQDRQLSLLVANSLVLIQPRIKIPEDLREIQISAEGTISILNSSDATTTVLGRIPLARVASPGRLKPVGQTLLEANEDSGPIVVGHAMAEGLGELQQGGLEQSNVDFQAEQDEIEELMMLLKATPTSSSRPVTASSPETTPAR